NRKMGRAGLGFCLVTQSGLARIYNIFITFFSFSDRNKGRKQQLYVLKNLFHLFILNQKSF
ncbi:hypothetical protein, partial [Bartonella sp. AC134YNZD]|uniref:hypothetical protein n=1 Tax=Bartonella sp. AC134YNZD TaxID=3243446 RepID=UPI0035CF396A